jgi:hypothetical protein
MYFNQVRFGSMLLKKSPQKICRIGKRNNRIVGTSFLKAMSHLFVEHCEAVAAGIDIKRRRLGEQ